jgi:hypothetical protein
MENIDKIFWAVIIAVGIWAALTPGRQLGWLPENRYRISNYIPPIVYVLMFIVLGGILFFNTK